MIIIQNMEHHKKQLEAAMENESFNLLLKELRYLHCYGGLADPNKIRVELGFDHNGYSAVWFKWSEEKKEYEHFMTGGLIYFPKDNTWSVHT